MQYSTHLSSSGLLFRPKNNCEVMLRAYSKFNYYDCKHLAFSSSNNVNGGVF